MRVRIPYVAAIITYPTKVMFENLEEYLKQGNQLKIFLSGARLRVVRSCDITIDNPKVYGEGSNLLKALQKADNNVNSDSKYVTEELFGDPQLRFGLEKILCNDTVYINRHKGDPYFTIEFRDSQGDKRVQFLHSLDDLLNSEFI